jgi:hypothetical protein
LQIDGLALDEFDGLLTEEAGDDEFFDLWWGGHDGGKSGGGIGADGDGDLQNFAGGFCADGDVFAGWQSFYPTQARRGLEWGTLGRVVREGGAAAGFCHAGDASGGCGF